jgi:hypothetical protein
MHQKKMAQVSRALRRSGRAVAPPALAIAPVVVNHNLPVDDHQVEPAPIQENIPEEDPAVAANGDQQDPQVPVINLGVGQDQHANLQSILALVMQFIWQSNVQLDGWSILCMNR